MGHPDTICDFVCESASQALSQYYIKKFGRVLHHNLDKGLLIAGKSKRKFGGGKILKKIKIIIAGRAVDRVGKTEIPVRRIAEEAVKKTLSKILNFSKKEIDEIFEISINYQSGASELQSIFKEKRVAIANDTSFGVAHFPLSFGEKLTLNLTNFLNSKKISQKFPFVGKDIKVMTLRKGEKFFFTFAIAFIDEYIKNVKDYFEKKERLKREIENYLSKFNLKSFEIVGINLDDPNSKNEEGIYLTVTGLSAEQGDDGQVGRGNRICGLITPCRQMSLLSQIGKPLDFPQIALIELNCQNFSKLKEKAYSICEEKLKNLRKIQENIIKGKYQLF